MAQHEVRLTKLGRLEIGSTDVRFSIGSDKDGKLGTLLISKGGIEWRPYKKQKRNLSWEKFDSIIRDHWGD
jgi:hypothetical protein